MSGVEPVTICPADDLQTFAGDVLARLGMGNDDARYMARIIIASELTGHECHGLRRLPEYVARWRSGAANPTARLRAEQDSGAVVLVDAQGGFGHVVMRDVTSLAIARAKIHGVGVIAVKRTEAAGRFADYCSDAADAGIATLVFANDSGAWQEVAPPGGRSARMSTNPIAAGIPRATRPHLVLDMATSSVASGRLAEARDRQEPIPTEWVNADGLLRHFGGLKGFGLAVIVEALAGSLTGGGTVRPDPKHDDQAILMIGIDVNHFRPLKEFAADVEAFTAHIKNVPLEAGAAPVRMPGESGAESAGRLQENGIPVRHFVRDRLSRLADELRLELPRCLRSSQTQS
jgi:hydroxycarboxylate dehydrogenase B